MKSFFGREFAKTFWASVDTGLIAGGIVRLAATDVGIAFLAFCGLEAAASVSFAMAAGIGVGVGVLTLPVYLAIWKREKAWEEVVRDYHSNFDKNKIKEVIKLASSGEYDRLLQLFIKEMEEQVKWKDFFFL